MPISTFYSKIAAKNKREHHNVQVLLDNNTRGGVKFMLSVTLVEVSVKSVEVSNGTCEHQALRFLLQGRAVT